MIYLIKKAGQIIKTDWVVTVPAVIFYLLFFQIILRFIILLQDNLLLVFAVDIFLSAVKLFINLFIAHAGKQLLEQGRANFSQALSLSGKDYCRALIGLVALVVPLKLSILQSKLGVLFAEFIFLIIAPLVVFKGKQAYQQMVKLLFSLQQLLRLTATLSLAIILAIPVIAILILLPKTLVPLLSAIISGVLTTYLVILVCCYLFQNRGEVC